MSRDFPRAGKGPSWEGRQALLGQRQTAPGPCGTEETRPLGTGPGGRPRTVSPHRGTRAPTRGLGLSRSLLSLWPGLLTPPEGRLFPGDSPSSFLSPCLFPGRCLALVSARLHLPTPQRCCVWGGRDERGGGNSTAKNKNKNRGQHTRLEKGTRTTSDFHSAEPRAEPVRQRGQSTEAGKSQAQGGGCWRRQPPLLS